MKILIEAHHPADIHFWRDALRILRERGHDYLLLSRDRDVMNRLLERLPEVTYKVVSRATDANRFPLKEFLERQWAVCWHVMTYRPDVVVSCMGSYTQSAALFGKPNVIFTDSEFQTFNHLIAHPFATSIHTPHCFYKPLGAKQRIYRGFHELASLAPQYFRNDRRVVPQLDTKGMGYAILRVSAWNTLHDVGLEGMAKRLREVISVLEKEMTVWISPEEGRIDEDLKPYQLSVHPDDYHQALANARIVVTEGASTASEAAVLGVPTLYVNPSARGYLDYLEERYGLVRQCQEVDGVLERIEELLRESAETDWKGRAAKLFEEHTDVVMYIVGAIEEAAGSPRQPLA